MIVIDSSVALKWVIEEEDSDRAADLLGRDLVAPDLILAECGNALWKRLRRSEIELPQALAGLAGIEQFVSLMPSRTFALRALEISAELQHPIYDCVFMAVAERLGAPLLTADVKFRNKIKIVARDCRVELLADFAG